MGLSNLPPGVTDSMIPGNRPEDEEWDRFFEEVTETCERECISVDLAITLWRLGLEHYTQYRTVIRLVKENRY